jgi:hypothetical protein
MIIGGAMMKRRASAPRLYPDRLGNQATPPVAYSETYKCSGPSRLRDEIAGANTHWLGGAEVGGVYARQTGISDSEIQSACF